MLISGKWINIRVGDHPWIDPPDRVPVYAQGAQVPDVPFKTLLGANLLLPIAARFGIAV